MPPFNEFAHNPKFDLSTIKGITADSRAVEPGFLFAALPGEKTDGHDFIPEALKRGASAILSDGSKPLPDHVCSLNISRETLRKSFGHLTADYYKTQPDQIVAVTGTNGKSSVVHFTNQLWQAMGKKSAMLGTLCGGLTTPDPVTLHKTFVKFCEAGITHTALEASSHGLAQYRLDGTIISVAAFTSFSQDHLDYHADMSEYLNAKMRLFSELLKPDGTAVLNADIPEYEQLLAICKQRKVKIISYGKNGKNITLNSAKPIDFKQDLRITINKKPYTVSLPLPGLFQAMNALCALGCVIAEKNTDTDRIVKHMDLLYPVPGRLQYVTNDTKNRHAYVDYAHTPDALETVLKTLRPHTKGKLICVFGCGGDRDKAKRPIMGKAAQNNADLVIITDDNPRSENASEIREAILKGAPQAQNISGRRKAIEFALSQMQEDDVLLLAGKGHEQGQIFKDRTEEFDDVKEVENALRT